MKPPKPKNVGAAVFALTMWAVVMSVLVVYLFTANRSSIREQEIQLQRLCATTTQLDIALIVPFMQETEAAIRELPPGSQRLRLRRFQRNLRVTHQILATTEPCEQVQ